MISPAVKTRCVAVLTLGLTLIAYVWITSSGTWTHWNRYTHFNSQLADSFLHRRLSLATRPSAALLALPDPYDPIANEKLRAHDLSLYHGKYYMYWGPTPAVIQAGIWWVLGIDDPACGDVYLGVAFAYGMIVLVTALVFSIRARFFASHPPGTAGIAIFSLAMSAPIFFSLSSTNVYETAIFGGQLFLLGGLCAAWFAFQGGGARPWLLVMTGVCWALSAGSRVSLPPALAALTLIALWQIHRSPPPAPRLRAAAALLLPLAIGAFLFGWYNYARFDSILETGATYQLSGQVQTKLFAEGFVSIGHIFTNFFAYLFTLPTKTMSFPYFVSVDASTWLRHFFYLWPDFRSEPVTGLVWTQSFLVFAPIALFMTRRHRPPRISEDGRLFRWLVISLCVGAALGDLPSLMMDGVTMRYLVDGLPCLGILAAIGYWQALEALAGRPRALREVRTAVRVIVPLECLLGLLLGVSRNPGLFHAFTHHFPLWWQF